ncbi:MAG: DUF45 domain-containing protein [Clostridia bacterium]|nr:DUF45 domain-containing protein [Clostridia bacterium]
MNLVKRNSVITYTVNKSEASNCYISVNNGEVVVSAPWYLTTAQIQSAVEEKKQWIVTKLSEYKNSSKTNKSISQESIKVLGNNYGFKIFYKNVKTPSIGLEDNRIKIILPNKYKKADINSVLKVLTKKMYMSLAEKEVEMAMEKARLTLEIAPEDYEICEMGNILGRCTSNKKIYINPDIVMFDRKVIEYVIFHEFCHLKYKNHTKSFYDLLESNMPDYFKYTSVLNGYQY